MSVEESQFVTVGGGVTLTHGKLYIIPMVYGARVRMRKLLKAP